MPYLSPAGAASLAAREYSYAHAVLPDSDDSFAARAVGPLAAAWARRCADRNAARPEQAAAAAAATSVANAVASAAPTGDTAAPGDTAAASGPVCNGGGVCCALARAVRRVRAAAGAAAPNAITAAGVLCAVSAALVAARVDFAGASVWARSISLLVLAPLLAASLACVCKLDVRRSCARYGGAAEMMHRAKVVSMGDVAAPSSARFGPERADEEVVQLCARALVCTALPIVFCAALQVDVCVDDDGVQTAGGSAAAGTLLLVLFLCWSAAQYAAVWERYFVGRWTISPLAGNPTDWHLLVLGVVLLDGVLSGGGVGGARWRARVPLAPLYPQGVRVSTFVVLASSAWPLLACHRRVVRVRRFAAETGRAFRPAVAHAAPFALAAGAALLWALVLDRKILAENAHLLVWTLGLVFCYISLRAALQAVCGERFMVFYNILLPWAVVLPLSFLGHDLLSHPLIPDLTLLDVYFAVALANVVFAASSSARELGAALGTRFFAADDRSSAIGGALLL